MITKTKPREGSDLELSDHDMHVHQCTPWDAAMKLVFLHCPLGFSSLKAQFVG
jgi:hypothetical protein